MTPRVLLTGPQWFGDLVPFCTRALSDLGIEHRAVFLNEGAWLPAAGRWRDRLARVPLVGPSLSWRLWHRARLRLAEEGAAAIRKAAAELRPDLILCIAGWGDPLSAEVLAEIKCPHKVAWLMDDPFENDGRLARMILAVDRVYVVEGSWVEPVTLATNRPAAALPCGADPARHRRVPVAEIPAELRGGVVFVGSSYAQGAAGLIRHRLLAAVGDLDLRIYGDSGWRTAGIPESLRRAYRRGEIPTEEANLVYNGADAVININHPQFRTSTGLRTFAIAAAGAFQLLDWRPGLERYFDPDLELVTYRSPDDLREKLLRYLGRPDERRRIGDAARRRTLSEHTYAHRLATILKDTGLWPAGAGVQVAAE